MATPGDNKSHARLFTLRKKAFSSQRVTFLKEPIIYCFIDDKNKETLIKIFLGLSMRTEETEENSEGDHCIIGTFFIQTDSPDCLQRISCTVCLLYIMFVFFQDELNHSVLGLCSLFTFKHTFGQLQQMRKRNEVMNTF